MFVKIERDLSKKQALMWQNILKLSQNKGHFPRNIDIYEFMDKNDVFKLITKCGYLRRYSEKKTFVQVDLEKSIFSKNIAITVDTGKDLQNIDISDLCTYFLVII